MRREVNVLALVKGEERYVYIYSDNRHHKLLEALQEHAAHPDLSLNWYDAAVLTRKAEDQVMSPSEPGEM